MRALKVARAFIAALAAAATCALADGAAPETGHLEPGGAYLTPAPGSTVSMLPDGSVFVFGLGPEVDERLPQRDLDAALRTRRNARGVAAPDPDPQLWDAKARGWRRLPRAPECEGPVRYLHTATVLADARVLVAGGLCDAPKMRDDPAPWPPHTRLSLWDGRAAQWVAGPELRQARIHHSATLLADGSVLIAGGESDPALSDAPHPVLASVERFTGATVRPAPPMLQARARHSATALPGGAVLVAGGFDAGGRATAAVEVLDAGAQAWRALPPLREPRHSHTATLLADGRVLVAGGKGADERALASTELWDPAREGWLSGPALPVALNGHAAARLANGTVLVAGGAWVGSALAPIAWAWTWSPATAEWEVAGHTMPREETDLSGGATIVPRADGSAWVFTPRAVLRWVPGAATPGPLWESKPALAPLRGGRVMAIGYEVGEPDAAIARVWDAATDRWTIAGPVGGRERMAASAVQLPSGRVIHVGVNMENTLACALWDPPARWEDCGALKFEYLHRGDPHAALLPDGRALVIVGEHEAAIYDEGARTWSLAALEWHREGFAYGAPVRQDKPLARVADPKDGRAIAIDEAAARYYNRNLSGGNMALLWDARAARWAYVFADHRMGGDAQWLPGGCAISTRPLAIFDASNAEARALPDPGLGVVGGESAMAVLDDGTVVVAGVSAAARDMGAGFFHRKASCAGFAAIADGAPYIAPDLAAAARTVAAPAAAAPTAPDAQGFGPFMTRVEAKAFEHRWLLLAIFAPLALYLALRRSRVGQARAPASRGFRIVIYVLIAVVIAPFALQFAAFHLFTSARECAESPLRCESDPPWWVALARKAKPAGAPPCKLVGIWSSRRGSTVNRIELKDDGSYAMAVGGRRYAGLWRVEGDKMVWQHEQAPGVRDVNPMEFLTDTRFNLTEEGGEVTRFELIRAVPSDKCTP